MKSAVMCGILIASLGAWTPGLGAVAPQSESAVELSDPVVVGDRAEYTFRIPQDGFYGLFLGCGGAAASPRQATIFVDGVSAIHYYQLAAEGESPRDRSCVRYLKPGPHTLTVAANHRLARPDVFTATGGSDRLTLRRLDAQGETRALAITEARAGQTVYRQGEPLVWIFEQATSKPEAYTVEVCRQRDDGLPVWTGSISLTGPSSYVRGEVRYPCPEEGAFEYRVLDDRQGVVEGPWEFVVVDPTPLPLPTVSNTTTSNPAAAGTLVDTVACTEASGGEHLFRDNATSRVVDRGDYAYRQTGDEATLYYYQRTAGKLGKGPWTRHSVHPKNEPDHYYHYAVHLDWFAYTVNIAHPETAHLVVLWLPTDRYRRITAQAIDHVTGHHNGAVFEVNPTTSGALTRVVFPFWPNSRQFDLIFPTTPRYHGTRTTESAVSRIEVYEYPDGLPPLPPAAEGWNPIREAGWGGEQLNLGMESRTTPRLWQGTVIFPEAMSADQWRMGMFYDYKALNEAWARFGEYSRYRGDNLLFWPVHTYDMAHVRGKRLPYGEDAFSMGYGFRPVDKYPRETLKLILLQCEKYGVGFFADFRLHYHDLAVFKRVIAETEGVSEEELDGVFLDAPWPKLNPCHPIARSFLKHLYGEIASQCGGSPAFRGIIQRNWGANMADGGFAQWEVGYGDYTIERFVRDSGLEIPAVPEGDDKLEFRCEFLMGDRDRRQAWFQWRAAQVSSLQDEMVAEMRRYAPQATLLLADQRTPDPELGAGWSGGETPIHRARGYYRRLDYSVPGVENNRPDPVAFHNFDVREGVQRSADPLEVLNKKYTYGFGMCTGSGAVAPPHSARRLASALAEQGHDMLLQGGFWALPPTDESLRNWIRTWRAIPSLEFVRLNNPASDPGRKDPVVCWQATSAEGETVCYFINVTDAAQSFDTLCEKRMVAARDRVSGVSLSIEGQRVAQTLPPYGLTLLTVEGGGAIEQLAFPPGDQVGIDLRQGTLVLRVENPGAAAREGDLALVSGATVLAAMDRQSIAHVDTRQLQVWLDGCALPMQVDEQDTTGRYVAAPNHRLDPDDELAFALSFASGETHKMVTLGPATNPVPRVSPFTIRSQDAETPETPWRVLVSHGLVEAGFGLARPESSHGGITYLKSGDTVLFGSRPRNYYAFMPIEWPLPAAAPRVVANGPVRCIVEMAFPGVTDLEWYLQNIQRRRYKREGFLRGASMLRQFEIQTGTSSIKQSYHVSYERSLIRDFNLMLGEFVKLQEYGGGELKDKTVIRSWRGKVEALPWTEAGLVLDTRTADPWLAVWDAVSHFGLALVMEEGKCSRMWHSQDWGRMIYANDEAPASGAVSFSTWVLPLRDGDPEKAMALRDRVVHPLQVSVMTSGDLP